MGSSKFRPRFDFSFDPTLSEPTQAVRAILVKQIEVADLYDAVSVSDVGMDRRRVWVAES